MTTMVVASEDEDEELDGLKQEFEKELCSEDFSESSDGDCDSNCSRKLCSDPDWSTKYCCEKVRVELSKLQSGSQSRKAMTGQFDTASRGVLLLES